MKIKDSAQKHLMEQRAYVKTRHLEAQRRTAKTAGATGLVDEKMLAQTMRAVRYQDEGHAAGDIIDNAIESGATQVHLAFRTDGTAIQEIAFIDDGSGIDPSFLPHATKWGGSSNEGRRNTFGRFGFGLPSASVNRGTRFTVYSRVAANKPFTAVTVDLTNLAVEGQVVSLPEPANEDLPKWVGEYVDSEDAETPFEGGVDAVRTVVVWSDLDRLQWKNRQQSTARFREHLGITYAGWLDVARLVVSHQLVEPVDVLFTTPDYRYYDIPGFAKADPQQSIRFDADDASGAKHEVTVRFSYLSIDANDATVVTGGKGRPKKVRQAIRKDYNGVFVTRNQRFIEVAHPAEIQWSNYARQVGMALDFPPELDELFGVTPDKQTIVFTDRVIAMLDAQGVFRAHKALVRQVTKERQHAKDEREQNAENPDSPRPSEETIAKVVSKDVRRTRKMGEETRQEAEDNFKERVKRLTEETGVPEDQIREAQEKQDIKKPYRLDFADLTEDQPFYVPTMDGTQTVLEINTEHPWYRDVYLRLTDNPEMRSALELMLFVLGTCELDSTGQSRVFYRNERRQWSRMLADAFDLHAQVFSGVATREEVEDDDPSAWIEDEADDLAEDEVGEPVEDAAEAA
jgi:Histidine kinase-, DNA gyrase B-, and HSP90-like ATPase